MRKMIISENKGKSSIYLIKNKLTGHIYVGQYMDLGCRFTKYYNNSYIKSKNYSDYL